MPKFQRKKYLVMHEMQRRFARGALVFMMSCCAVTGAVVFFATFMVLHERLAGVYPEARLSQIIRTVYLALFLGLLMVAPVIYYGAIIFSHRVVGPLPKIYKALKEIGQGRFDVRLVLRKNDELKELAEEINAMAAQLEARGTKKE